MNSASGFLAAGKFEADQPAELAFQIPVCALRDGRPAVATDE